MTTGYEISLARPDDIPGILALQELNLIERGGGLSVRQTADWFGDAIGEKSLVVGRRDGRVVGYVVGTSAAAKTHVTIIQTMLRRFLRRPIATFTVRFAWPRLSAATDLLLRCSKNCRRR